MGWSLTIGRFAGTAVRIHITFLLFLAWIGFSAYEQGGLPAARDSVFFIVAIFTCVVLHEFGHILMARRFGVKSTQITLWPIGGVADLNKMPEKPSQELLIALAGPAVNIVIAAALLFGVAFFEPQKLSHLDHVGRGLMGLGLVEQLAVTNLFLAAFNMVPAFPMDGGRVLRAALAMWLGQGKATRVAALIGQGFAFVLGFLGLLGHPMLLFIAVFVFFAASGEAQMTSVAQATKDVKVADVMETRILALGRGASVGEAVELLLTTPQEVFPLLDSGGRLTGLVSRDDIAEALKSEGGGAPVLPFAQKDAPTIAPNDTLDQAIDKLQEASAIGVVDAEGVFKGLVSRQSLAEVMLIKSARPDWRFARRV